MNIDDIKNFIESTNSDIEKIQDLSQIKTLFERIEQINEFLLKAENLLINCMQNYQLTYNPFNPYNISFNYFQNKLNFYNKSKDDFSVKIDFDFHFHDMSKEKPDIIQQYLNDMNSIYASVYNYVFDFFEILNLKDAVKGLSNTLKENDSIFKKKYISENLNQSFNNVSLNALKAYLTDNNKLYSIALTQGKLQLKSHSFSIEEDSTHSRLIDFIKSYTNLNISDEHLHSANTEELNSIIQYHIIAQYNSFSDSFVDKFDSSKNKSKNKNLNSYVKEQLNYIKNISECELKTNFYVDGISYDTLEDIQQKFLFSEDIPMNVDDANKLIKLPLEQLYELAVMKTNLKDF